MATLLLQEGYKISVVTPKIYKNSHYFEEQKGIKVYRFPFFARNKLLIEYRKIPYVRMFLYYVSGFFLTVYGVFKNRCDLIHVHWAIPTGLIGVLAGKLLGKPVVVTIHGSDFRMATERFSFLNRIFLYVCQTAKRIICVSEFQAEGIEKMGVGEEKISIFPMGIDESFLEVGRNRGEKLNVQSHSVLSNRNLLPIYNVSLLIRAIPMVLREESKATFLIAGEGLERKNLEKEAKNLNVNSAIQFLGRIPHKEMPHLLGEADIYVSTSLYDGTSVSLLEAMACGAFPIVTDIPSNREWISDGENGFLIPIDNEVVLAKKIVEAIRNTRILMEARDKNQKIMDQRAHWNNHLKKIIQLYESALQLT